MIGIKVGRNYAVVCDNWGCQLHRQVQGNIERSDWPTTTLSTFMPDPLPKVYIPRGVKKGQKLTRRKGLEYARKTL